MTLKEILEKFRDGEVSKRTGLRLEVYDIDEAEAEILKHYISREEFEKTKRILEAVAAERNTLKEKLRKEKQ